jgi:hypothetical protein
MIVFGCASFGTEQCCESAVLQSCAYISGSSEVAYLNTIEEELERSDNYGRRQG